MRIQKLKNKIPRKIILSTIILLPMVFGGVYLGVYFGIVVPDLTSFMEVPPDTSEFYDLDLDINLTRLEEIGSEFEHLQDEHLPINISQTITRSATTGEVIYFHGTDNGELHTIENLVASCLRYTSLPSGAEKDLSLYLIRKMTDAMRLFIEIPNGGLGPNFPGTLVARFYAPPDRWNDGNYTWIFDEHYRHFNGTDGTEIHESGTDYTQWRMRLYTSKDEMAAYFGGLAALLTLVDVPDIQEITRLIIIQLMEGMLSSFWQEMGGVGDPGKPDGVHFQPPSGAVWKLLLTKMAMIVDPENLKYKQLHHYYLAKERKVENVMVVGKTDNIDNYYSHYFNSFVLLGLFLVEDNQEVLNLYFKNFHEKTYISYRGHRNAMLNALYLAGAAKTTRTTHFDLDSIRWDVLDQLWRFSERGLVPFDTTIGGENRTVNRTEVAGVLGSEWLEIDPNIAKWKNFVDNTWFGGLYKWLVYGLQDALLEDRFLKPATVDMMRPKETIWNQNPYRETGVHIYNTTNYITQYAGASFTLPYYILKYFGYVEVA